MSTIKKIIALLLGLSFYTQVVNAQNFDRRFLHKASFEEKVLRYPSPATFFQIIQSLAPALEISSGAYDTHGCLKMAAETSAIVGGIDPQQGQPLESEPGPFFYTLFATCAESHITQAFTTSSQDVIIKNSKAVLGKSFFETNIALLLPNVTQENQIWNNGIYVSAMPKELKIKLMDRLIFFLLGPDEVLRHYKYIGDNNVFAENLNSAEDLRNYLIPIFFDGERYKQKYLYSVYSAMAAVLKLGPLVQH